MSHNKNRTKKYYKFGISWFLYCHSKTSFRSWQIIIYPPPPKKLLPSPKNPSVLLLIPVFFSWTKVLLPPCLSSSKIARISYLQGFKRNHKKKRKRILLSVLRKPPILLFLPIFLSFPSTVKSHPTMLWKKKESIKKKKIEEDALYNTPKNQTKKRKNDGQQDKQIIKNGVANSVFTRV